PGSPRPPGRRAPASGPRSGPRRSWHHAHAPDVARVLGDGPVARELAHAGDVEDGRAGPPGRVAIDGGGPAVGAGVGLEVGEVDVRLAVLEQAIGDGTEEPGLSGTEPVRGEGVHDPAGVRAGRVEPARIVPAGLVQRLDLRGG